MKFLHSLLTLSQFSLQASQFASWTVFRTFRSRCILIEYTAKPESLHSEKVNIIISQFQCCWLRLPPHLPHVFMQFIFIHLLLWQLFQYFEQSKQNYTEHKVGPAHVMCHVYLYQAPEANFGTPIWEHSPTYLYFYPYSVFLVQSTAKLGESSLNICCCFHTLSNIAKLGLVMVGTAVGMPLNCCTFEVHG